MNIIFLTRFDPKDINSWSGTLYYIYNKLKESHHIEVIGTEILEQLNVFTRGNFPAETFIPIDRYPRVFNKLLAERVNVLDSDLIFFGDLLFVPFLEVNIPIVYLTDITFDQLRPHYREPDEKKDESCIYLEKLIFEKSAVIIYCSDWIKKETIKFYGTDPNKIEVVELGANISTPTDFSVDISMDVCHLVFIGKDWQRKGGDIALDTYKLLKEEGFSCTLTIIGATSQNIQGSDKDLIVIPNLDKSIEGHSERLYQILSESHFLFLPTRFDAYGIVFCEASAYSLPSIATNIGGVGSPVREGKNGFLLPLEATAKDYAEKIMTVFNDKENYWKLRASSRHEFETRLNWDIWGETVNKILENTVEKWKMQNAE